MYYPCLFAAFASVVPVIAAAAEQKDKYPNPFASAAEPAAKAASAAASVAPVVIAAAAAKQNKYKYYFKAASAVTVISEKHSFAPPFKNLTFVTSLLQFFPLLKSLVISDSSFVLSYSYVP